MYDPFPVFAGRLSRSVTYILSGADRQLLHLVTGCLAQCNATVKHMMHIPRAHADAAAAPTLSVHAQAWLAQLPARVRPHGMAAYAPDLANRLSQSWDDGPRTDSLLEVL